MDIKAARQLVDVKCVQSCACEVGRSAGQKREIDFLANEPSRAQALLADPEIMGACDELLRFGKGAILNFAPASKLSRMTMVVANEP